MLATCDSFRYHFCKQNQVTVLLHLVVPLGVSWPRGFSEKTFWAFRAKSRNLSLMKRFCSIAFLAFTLAALSSFTANASGTTALVNGTVIDPASARILPNAVVLIEGDRIKFVGDQTKAILPKHVLNHDCQGKFILPGYIDTHVHFFQSGDISTRPDAVDLTGVRPYKDEVAWVRHYLPDTLKRYIRCGITAVVDVGGPLWNFEVRKIANSTAKAPRVAVAGPLISSVSRPQLDLGDPPIVKIDTPEQAREMVRKLAAQKPDFIKIWYIVPPAQPAPTPGEGGLPSPVSGQSDAERAAI